MVDVLWLMGSLSTKLGPGIPLRSEEVHRMYTSMSCGLGIRLRHAKYHVLCNCSPILTRCVMYAATVGCCFCPFAACDCNRDCWVWAIDCVLVVYAPQLQCVCRTASVCVFGCQRREQPSPISMIALDRLRSARHEISEYNMNLI